MKNNGFEGVNNNFEELGCTNTSTGTNIDDAKNR